MEIFQTFALAGAWIVLLTLIFLEVVLGIDNVVFISITTSRLAQGQQKPARTTGLLLAMLARIALLFGVSILMQLTKPIFSFSNSWVSGAVSWQSLIVLAGGLFLLYKSVTEVHQKLEGRPKLPDNKIRSGKFWAVISQIVILDMIFSFDSILTAIGIVGFKTYGYEGSMTIMITAIVIAVIIMLWFSGWISKIVNKYPSIQMLALSFLLLIAVMLLVESAHLSNLTVLGKTINEIPRGYIYFSIAFSLMVEMFNIHASRKKKR
jgi:predicted tellurium resistance membrane protein TerC